ncbi:MULTISPECIES: ABC transporter permease [Flavobacterium]|jgi:ABC-type transport system involved in multi-copper enzyme maturation permease subunit|uniref:ABC-2 family transporter n=2 Tax=Flavobacterium TaxID=237 RepID=A0A562KNX6_9FLAO|nr:ABC transporter permease [Flavobacterium cheniae]TDR23060.1 ABC-2 family transporter [Flavobacterium cheniae]TWH97080.1 ABC-2 family transporter [Flavobacterium cheniae]
MKRLLSIEFQKIWKNKASRVLLLAYFVLLSFIALIASIKFSIGTFEIRIADQGIFNFPYIWHFNTYIASLFKIFLAIVIVSMMANEYTYGTLKQNLIDGLSKKEFILSKFLVVGTFAVASTLFVFVMSLILGYSFSSYNEMGIVFSDLEYLLAFFVKLTAFFSFCLFLGILVKRSAFALGFLFIWFIAENIFYWIIKFVILGGDDKHKNFGDTIIQFFPMESMGNLIKEPFTRLSAIKTIETTIGGAKVAKDYSVHFSEISIALLWAFIFILTSYYILKKRDL